MSAFIDYYEVLEVSPGARQSVIDKAYRALMLEEHPDRGGDTRKAQLINEAYQVLGDPARRTEFDRRRASTAADRRPTPSPSSAGSRSSSAEDARRQEQERARRAREASTRYAASQERERPRTATRSADAGPVRAPARSSQGYRAVPRTSIGTKAWRIVWRTLFLIVILNAVAANLGPAASIGLLIVQLSVLFLLVLFAAFLYVEFAVIRRLGRQLIGKERARY